MSEKERYNNNNWIVIGNATIDLSLQQNSDENYVYSVEENKIYRVHHTCSIFRRCCKLMKTNRISYASHDYWTLFFFFFVLCDFFSFSVLFSHHTQFFMYCFICIYIPAIIYLFTLNLIICFCQKKK